MKKLKYVKGITVRIVAIILFAAIIASVILWQAGVYEISFIKRPQETSASDTRSHEQTEPPETDIPVTEPAIKPETTFSKEEMDSLLDGILPLSQMTEKGYTVSKSIFSDKSTIARASFDFGKTSSLSYHSEKTSVKQMVQNESSGLYSLKDVTVNETVPAVRLYYGLVIVDDGKNFSIYNTSGKLLKSNFSGTLIYAKTLNGKPAVKIGNKYYEVDSSKGLGGAISEDQINYKAVNFDYPSYYYSGSSDMYPYMDYTNVYVEVTIDTIPKDTTTAPVTKAPTETETDTPSETSQEDTNVPETNVPETDPPETEPAVIETETEDTQAPESTETVEINVQPSEAAPVDASPSDANNSGKEKKAALPEGVIEKDGKYYKTEKAEVWGYKNGKGEVAIEAQFNAVYPFSSNGLAAVTDNENRLMFIDKSGKTVISLVENEVIYPESLGKMHARQSYREAISNGIESLGMYNFNNGYVMVRRVLTGFYYKNSIYENVNVLVSEKGKTFPVPAGYELINYSDGILLVKKNGLYGYIKLDGSWAKPAVFSDAQPFIQGLASVKTKDGKCGMINSSGEYILPPCFDYVSNVSNGYVATFSSDRGWELYAVISK